MNQAPLADIAAYLRASGEGGDDHLVHVNDDELAMLMPQGYDINPITGLPQFGLLKKVKKAVKKTAKVVGNVAQATAPFASLVPGIGPVAAAALGAGGSLLSGDSLSTALKSGLYGGLGSLSLGAMGASGGLGSLLGGMTGAVPAGGWGAAVSSAFGPGATIGGSGLGSTLSRILGNATQSGNNGQQAQGGDFGPLLSALGAGGIGALLANQIGDGQNSYGVQTSVMTPQMTELFNRPNTALDINKLRQDATPSGMGLTDYVSQNWDKFMGGQYRQPAALAGLQSATPKPLTTAAPQNFACGGLAMATGGDAHVRGPGHGREDLIDAKLSNNEYIMDAETVAMLGNGSPDAGARRLDHLREAVRRHKGPALAKGKMSPDAKSPLAYMRGDDMPMRRTPSVNKGAIQ